MATPQQLAGGLQQASAMQSAPPENDAPETAQAPPDPIAATLEKTRQGRQLLNDQIMKLQSALEKRTQPMFDPKALRLLQESTRPTKTGHFLEALGNMAGGYGEAQESEIARNIETEKSKLDLFTKQKEMLEKEANQEIMIADLVKKGMLPPSALGPTYANYKPETKQAAPVVDRGEQLFDRYSGQGARPTEKASTTSGPIVPPSKATNYVPVPQNEQQNLPQGNEMRPVSYDDLVLFGRIAPEYGKQLKTESDEYLKGLITTTEGVYNKWTGKYDLKFDKPIEAQFPFVDGPQKVMSSVYDDYKYLSDISDKRNLPQNEKEQLLKRFYADKGITSDLNRKRSEKQMEADISVDSEAQKERTKSNEKVYTKELEQVHNLAQSAPEIRSSAQNVYQLAVSPNANQVFGLFSNAGMRDAILGVIAESGTSKGINLGAVYAAAQKLGKNVPTIAGESPQDYQKRVDKNIGMTQQAAGQLAILEVNFRKLIQGQGQVTNQESQMVARIGPVLTDRPEVVALKAKAVIAKATLLQEVDAIIQRELETNPRATISSIRNNSQAYKNAYKDYDLYLQKIQRDVFKD